MNRKEKIGVAIWIIFAVVLTTIVVHGLRNSNIYSEDNDHVCQHSCWGRGWEYGQYLGGSYCNCYDNPIVQTKCFQRVLREDRIFDIGTNIMIHGSFYNTTWHETECGRYDDFVLGGKDEN